MKINRAIKKTIILLLSMAIVFITAFACSCGWFKKPDNNGNGGNNGGEIVNPNPNPDPKPEDKPKPGDPHPSAVGLPDRRATEEEKILNFKKGYKQKRGRSCFVRTRRVSAFPGKKTPAGKSHGRLDILFAFRRAVS